MLETPKQIKMARILLEWSQQDLADTSGLHIHTIRRLEQSKNFYGFNVSIVNIVKMTFEAKHILFIDKDDAIGVAIKRDETSLLS